MNKTVLSMALVMGMSAAYSLPAYSQVKPNVLVKQRQAAMTLQGKYFYPIRNMAQGKIPYSADIVARNIIYMDSLARMPWDGFAPGTKDTKSQATPAVFTDTAKFKEAADRYMAEMTRLADMSRKGADEASLRNQILAVDKACNSCHETFRERE
jgi:cytochrome c556